MHFKFIRVSCLSKLLYHTVDYFKKSLIYSLNMLVLCAAYYLTCGTDQTCANLETSKRAWNGRCPTDLNVLGRGETNTRRHMLQAQQKSVWACGVPEQEMLSTLPCVLFATEKWRGARESES